ncbi:hypothetical protein c7_L74 [Megavirus courdo7]|uniref:Uncharacterized protein n=1 Tax=Megavirus courdo7 TaxID=1128135 RepID=H2E9R7_9VIRU|nr:hypothetical protein c7_L74 [Megavirus courdo7]
MIIISNKMYKPFKDPDNQIKY